MTKEFENELHDLAPFLADVKRQATDDPFKVPQLYFDTLADAVELRKLSPVLASLKAQSLDNQWLIIGLEWSDTAVIWSINRRPFRYLSLQKVPPCLVEWVFKDAANDIFMDKPKSKQQPPTSPEERTRCRYLPFRKPLPFTFRIGTAYGCIADDCGKGRNQLKYANLPQYVQFLRFSKHKWRFGG